MARNRDQLQGSLDLLVLKTLAQGAMHGWGITLHIERVSDEILRVEEGSLYPALHRMEQAGWVRAEWGGEREPAAGALLQPDGDGAEAAGS